MAFLEYPFFNNRPSIPVIITNPLNKKSVSTYVLVDTGADNCIFPGALAEALGHVLKDPKVPTAGTIGIEGNKLPTWKHPFTISLPDNNN